MKKLKCIFLNCIWCFLLCTSFSYSQGTWTQKTNVFTSPRAGVVGFSIGNKGYLGTGWQFGANQIFYSDFWEWDQGISAWTQKANFPDSARGDAVGFSIGFKGYILTGRIKNGINATNELWEWDQSSNTWSQKAMFPGATRLQGTSFSIGLKGYVGCGYNNSLGHLNDFWEYNQLTNSWMQKANVPVIRAACVSFSIGNKGYIFTGDGNSSYLNDTWEFDPLLNNWTQKANFPGGARSYASGFAIDGNGYVGTGYEPGNSQSDFWRFNPLTNIWTQMTNYPHLVSDIDEAGFSIGCNGYFGTGATSPSASPFYNDFWEYEPDTCSLTGIEILNLENLEFLISPNPFSEKLNIRIHNSQLSEIIIYDSNSKKVLQKKFVSAVSLDTKSFAKGIYIYEVRNNPGASGKFFNRGKIVKD